MTLNDDGGAFVASEADERGDDVDVDDASKQLFDARTPHTAAAAAVVVTARRDDPRALRQRLTVHHRQRNLESLAYLLELIHQRRDAMLPRGGVRSPV